jgi:hypothetical protein
VKKWQELNRQDFIDMNATMTGSEIARQFGVTSGAVYYRFRMFGINGTRSSKRFAPAKDEITSLYQTMSMKELAKHYGVGETAVFMYLKLIGVDPISRSDRLSGKPKSLEHRLAMSRARRVSGLSSGEKNGNWQGGVSSANLRGRSKAAYFDWKNAVLANAVWKCQGCSLDHGHVCECCGHRVLLHAHHVKPYANHPQLRYDVSNGLALCERCHKKVHHNQSGELLEIPESQATTAESK